MNKNDGGGDGDGGGNGNGSSRSSSSSKEWKETAKLYSLISILASDPKPYPTPSPNQQRLMVKGLNRDKYGLVGIQGQPLIESSSYTKGGRTDGIKTSCL
ncbi:hypothetical protein M0804_013437 [Polistes exclamans]|nr:hypothetical protein M0804_013437 [Polistes exclamans]